jgi:hypothetical protein
VAVDGISGTCRRRWDRITETDLLAAQTVGAPRRLELVEQPGCRGPQGVERQVALAETHFSIHDTNIAHPGSSVGGSVRVDEDL